MSRIRPRAPVKARTTYIPPELEEAVREDLREIDDGEALRTITGGYLATSGRVYVDEGNGTFYPKDGPGLIGPVNRGTNRALTIFARYNGANERAMSQIRQEKGITSDDLAVALSIWSLRPPE